MSPVRVRLSAPLTNPAFAGFLILGGSGENRRFGTERSAVKGAQQNHQEHRDWVDFVWELYSPVIRPIIKRPKWDVFYWDFSMFCDIMCLFGEQYLFVFFYCPQPRVFFYGEKQ